MLKTFIEGPDGTYLNSLLRFVRSGLVVPSQANVCAKMLPASGNNPGMSKAITLEGPQDARTEIMSIFGEQGVANLGTGTITSVGGTALSGTGTKFLTELQAGDTIIVSGQTASVSSVTSDTAAVLTGPGFAPDVASVAFAYKTAINTDVRDRMTVEIKDTAFNRMFSNAPIPVRHVFGTAKKPMFLMESSLLETNQTLMFRFFNNSSSAGGSMTFGCEGLKWQDEAYERNEVKAYIQGMRQRKTTINPFWLTFDSTFTIGANSSANKFMVTPGDTCLVLFNLYGHAISSGAAGDTTEKVSIQMYHGRNERPLQNQPFTLNTGCGLADQPFVLPTPMILHPRDILRIKVTNLITDQPTDFFMSFHGISFMTYGSSAVLDPNILAEARRIWNATKPQIIPADVQ